ncbi:MAG: metalloregulator ArsR/SmtB family transcription factor [Devosia sp.]|nr:metalloregulator ArsR/SmtB family transcription factor [Devosia sp.]
MSPVPQFSALADATRCRVLELLRERPRPVHDLAEAFDISRPAISRHLKVLKDAGLVREEKRGRENVYALDATELAAVNRWLTGFWTSPLATLKTKAKPAAGALPIADLFALDG